MISIQRRVTDRILDMLDRRKAPWRQPLRLDPNCGAPMNVRTNRVYRGVNPILLYSATDRFGLHSKWWGTEEDWRGAGVLLRDDAIGVNVVTYLDNRYGEEVVYNADQLSRSERFRPRKTEAALLIHTDLGTMKSAVEATRADIRIGEGDEKHDKFWMGYVYPYPYPMWPHHLWGDYILMPPLTHHLIETWFVGLFHELIHWAEKRTNFYDRMSTTELVAEIGSFYLAQDLQCIPCDDVEHYNKWREAWMLWIDKDEDLIFRVAAQARRAADYVLSFSRAARNGSYYHDADPLVIRPVFPEKAE